METLYETALFLAAACSCLVAVYSLFSPHRDLALWCGFGAIVFSALMLFCNIQKRFWEHDAQKAKQQKEAPSSATSANTYPRIVVEAIGINDFAPNNKTGVSIRFKNDGDGMAKDVKVKRYITIKPYPFPPTEDFPDAPHPEAVLPSLRVGEQVDSHVMFAEPLTEFQCREIVAGTSSRLYVAALVSYSDEHGKPHLTRYMACVGGRLFELAIADHLKGNERPIPWEFVTRFLDAT